MVNNSTLNFEMSEIKNIEIESSNSQQNNEIVEITIDNFEKEVLESEKIVLIDFYATWCGPCNKLAPVLEKYAKENSDIKIVKLDIDNVKEIKDRYNVEGYPTMIIMENGEEIYRILGFREYEELKLEIQGAIQK